MGDRVFISYARKDEKRIKGHVGLLRAAGVDAFLDTRGLEPGDVWERVLEENVKSCDRMIVFWSKKAAKSEWVRREYQQAIDHGLRVVPVRLDRTRLPEDLAARQAELAKGRPANTKQAKGTATPYEIDLSEVPLINPALYLLSFAFVAMATYGVGFIIGTLFGEGGGLYPACWAAWITGSFCMYATANRESVSWALGTLAGWLSAGVATYLLWSPTNRHSTTQGVVIGLVLAHILAWLYWCKVEEPSLGSDPGDPT